MIIKWHLQYKTLPKCKSLPFGIEMKGEFNSHKYSSRCPHLTLSSKPGMLCDHAVFIWAGLPEVLHQSWDGHGGAGGECPGFKWCFVCALIVCTVCAFAHAFYLLLFFTSSLLCFKQKAVEVMCFVPKRCNDMMNVGRLQGFEVRLRNLDPSFKSLPNISHASCSAHEKHTATTSSLCCVYIFYGTRGRSQPRANCSSKTPSLLPNRTVASCQEPRKDGSSCLSSWWSSVSQSIRRRVSHSLDTSSKTA